MSAGVQCEAGEGRVGARNEEATLGLACVADSLNYRFTVSDSVRLHRRLIPDQLLKNRSRLPLDPFISIRGNKEAANFIPPLGLF